MFLLSENTCDLYPGCKVLPSCHVAGNGSPTDKSFAYMMIIVAFGRQHAGSQMQVCTQEAVILSHVIFEMALRALKEFAEDT